MNDYTDAFGEGRLNDRVDAERLVDEIGLDAAEIAWRKGFIDFDERDEQRLERFETLFQEHAQEIADSFYDHLTAHEETRAVFERSSKGIEQLKRTQMAYLMTLAAGEYDEAYFRNRARIGKLHELLDMPVNHYIGQYNVYYGLLLSLVTERIHDRLAETVADAVDGDEGATSVDSRRLTHRLYEDVEMGIDELHSILKLLNLDLQVAMDTYIQSFVDDIELERDRFAALFENAPTPVVIVRSTDDGERVEQVNPAFEELFGYTAEDLPDKSFEHFLSPPGEEPRPIEYSGFIHELDGESDGKLAEAEVTFDTRFGRREFIRISAPINRPGLDDLDYAFYIDVTNQKQQQERLQVLSRVLRHDCRNQMNVIQGYNDLLKQSIDEDTRKEVADRIDEASEQFLKTSRQIREVERLIAGDADYRPVNVARLTESVFSDVRETYPECSFSHSLDESAWVIGTDALRIALRNVIENGAEYNDAAEPFVVVTASQNPSGRYVDVRISDNGPGIPPAEYEILTGERDRSQIEHSSGLGLWTVNWIVTNCGGTLDFGDNDPRGATVTLRLPRADPPTESEWPTE